MIPLFCQNHTSAFAGQPEQNWFISVRTSHNIFLTDALSELLVYLVEIKRLIKFQEELSGGKSMLIDGNLKEDYTKEK
jgi:hypothetical protein